MSNTNFNPSKHAFKFENTFENQVKVLGLSSLPWIGSKFEMETNGLCGGMAFAALDYYHSNRPTPDVTSANSTLREYLLKRQLDSFKYRDSWRFYRWTRRSNSTIVPKTLENEIPKAKESIDKGIPVVLGLVGATRIRDIGDDNHQVVCYGYDEDASGKTTLYVYDPNCPPKGSFTGELELIPFFHQSSAGVDIPDGPNDPSGPVQNLSATPDSPGYNRFRIKRADAGKSDSIWRGFFVQRYSKRSNPPLIRSSERDNGRGTVRDHRNDRRRDHRERDSGPVVRDHRTGSSGSSGGTGSTIVRDHRNQNTGGVNPNPDIRERRQMN
jgi:hypothetical protein